MQNLKEDTSGNRLKKYRLLLNLTQKKLSELAGIDRITVIDLETGNNPPTLELCNKLGQSLNIDPKFLYDDYLNFISGNYGLTINNIRKKLNLKLAEFSKLLDIDRHVIKRWENYKSQPTRSSYDKIKKFLD